MKRIETMPFDSFADMIINLLNVQQRNMSKSTNEKNRSKANRDEISLQLLFDYR